MDQTAQTQRPTRVLWGVARRSGVAMVEPCSGASPSSSSSPSSCGPPQRRPASGTATRSCRGDRASRPHSSAARWGETVLRKAAAASVRRGWRAAIQCSAPLDRPRRRALARVLALAAPLGRRPPRARSPSARRPCPQQRSRTAPTRPPRHPRACMAASPSAIWIPTAAARRGPRVPRSSARSSIA